MYELMEAFKVMAGSFWSPYLLLPFLALIAMLGLTVYLVYSGIFRHISVDTKAAPYGGMTVAYKTGKGAYKDTSILHAEAEQILPNHLHIGLFYDDPESVPESELRYAVGLILSWDEKDPDPASLQTMLDGGFKVAVLPAQEFAVVSSFTLTTALSLYIAIFRVYPRLRNYISTMNLCAYPAIEICDSKSMYFVMPLSRQEEFFVAEFSEEQVSIATTEVSNHPDHAGVDALLRTSSRNSNQLGEESKRTPSEDRDNNSETSESHNPEESGDGVFVKPTKPAPRKAVKSSKTQSAEESMKTQTDDNTAESSSSSFDDLCGEKFQDDSEDDKN